MLAAQAVIPMKITNGILDKLRECFVYECGSEICLAMESWVCKSD